jgi:hypothetical protein
MVIVPEGATAVHRSSCPGLAFTSLMAAARSLRNTVVSSQGSAVSVARKGPATCVAQNEFSIELHFNRESSHCGTQVLAGRLECLCRVGSKMVTQTAETTT